MTDSKLRSTHLKMLKNINKQRSEGRYLKYSAMVLGAVILGYFFYDMHSTQRWIKSLRVEKMQHDILLLQTQNDFLKTKLSFLDAVIAESPLSEASKHKVGELQSRLKGYTAIALLGDLHQALVSDAEAVEEVLLKLQKVMPEQQWNELAESCRGLVVHNSMQQVYSVIQSISKQEYYHAAEINDLEVFRRWIESIVRIRKAADIAKHMELQRLGGTTLQLFRSGEIRAVFLIAERLKKHKTFFELYEVLLPVMKVLKTIEDAKVTIKEAL